MEKSTPIGLVAGMMLIFGTILTGDGAMTFIDPGSFALVVGGTAAALMVAFSFADLKAVLGITKEFFAYQPPALGQQAETFVAMARMARREGMLSLEARLEELDDELAQAALTRAIDGAGPDTVHELLDDRVVERTRGRQLGVTFYNTAGTYAPAFGMVGTLIGLIQMLQNLDDPSAVGPAMAVAMITTFYGALLANLVFLPLAAKMKAQLTEDLRMCDLIRAAVVGLVDGEPPSILEERLRTLAGLAAAPPEPVPA